MKLNREDYSKVTESPEFKVMMAEAAIDKIDDIDDLEALSEYASKRADKVRSGN